MRKRYQRGAMRGVFWLLAMASMAVALALLMGDNDATVTLFWFPYRFDASFNLILVLLLASFALLYLGLRGFATLREIPRRARRWRDRQIERAAVSGILDALAYQLAGRFVRAHTSAGEALRHLDELSDEPAGLNLGQMRLLANLLAAESAQSLQNRGARDEHLGVALQSSLARHAPDAHEGALLRAIRWAIEDRNPSLARSRLQDVPQGAARRIQALRLRLRVARLDGSVAEALEVTRLLTKHRAFSPDAGKSLVRGLALDALRQARDFNQLQNVWHKLTESEKSMPELVLAGGAACSRAAAPGDRHRVRGAGRWGTEGARLDRTDLAPGRQSGRRIAAAPGQGDRARHGTRGGTVALPHRAGASGCPWQPLLAISGGAGLPAAPVVGEGRPVVGTGQSRLARSRPAAPHLAFFGASR